MNAIAVLTTITPTDDLLKFYSGFVRLGYRVFVVIDDNNLKLDNARLKAKNAGVSLIQIEDYECRRAGFFNFTGFRTRTGCAAWDKAIYYFCCRDPSDDNIWFIEDDVFVPSHEIIVAIDRKYESADIISADNVMNKYGALDEDGWPWWRLVPRTILPPPWAHCMVCAVRLSRKMLAALDSFIRSNKNKLRFTNAVIAVIKVAGLLRQKSLWRKRLHVEYI